MTSRRKSYAILAACTLVYFLTMIPLRISAIIFVACIERYKVSRAIAAYPSVLFTSVRCLMGPVVAYLSDKIGIKTTITIGCAISGLGMAACYLAEHIAFVIISFGIVSGFGASLSVSLIHHVLRPYFKDDYSLVCGISMNGGSLGSFVFPPIAEKLIKEFGVSGMFLIIGGLMLNGIPVSFLIQEKVVKKVLMKPNQIPKQITSLDDNNIIFYNNDDFSKCNIEKLPDALTEHQKPISLTANQNKTAILTSNGKKECMQNSKAIDGTKHVVATNNGKIDHNVISTNSRYAQKNIFNCYENNVQTEDENISRCNANPSHSYPLKESHQNKSSELENVSPKLSEETHTGGTESVDENFKTVDARLQCVETHIQSVSSKVSGKEHGTTDTEVTEYDNTLTLCSGSHKKTEEIEAVCSRSSRMVHDSKNKSCLVTLRTHFYTYLDPSVMVILLAAGSVTYVYLIIMTITIDLSREKNLPRENEIYLLTVGSATEIVGNLFLGRIPDKGYLSRIQFTVCSFLGYAVVCALLVWTTNFATYLIGITCFGFFVSGTFLTIPGLVYEFVDEKKQTMVQASKFMLYGVLCFTASPLIGYFRDNRGSYTGVLYVQSLICVACAIMIGILPLLAKRKMSEK